jgi:hypothetical protein
VAGHDARPWSFYIFKRLRRRYTLGGERGFVHSYFLRFLSPTLKPNVRGDRASTPWDTLHGRSRGRKTQGDVKGCFWKNRSLKPSKSQHPVPAVSLSNNEGSGRSNGWEAVLRPPSVVSPRPHQGVRPKAGSVSQIGTLLYSLLWCSNAVLAPKK